MPYLADFIPFIPPLNHLRRASSSIGLEEEIVSFEREEG
jgi:hypothetical protein